METKKKQPKLYDLSELEGWLEKYTEWYNQNQQASTQDDSGSNPGNPPPPPPGHP